MEKTRGASGAIWIEFTPYSAGLIWAVVLLGPCDEKVTDMSFRNFCADFDAYVGCGGDDDDVTSTLPSSAEVICVSSGTKCINGEQLSLEGCVINDSHAEIVARFDLLYPWLPFCKIWDLPICLFLDNFFSWYIVLLHLINFTKVIYDWKLESKRKSIHRSVLS